MEILYAALRLLPVDPVAAVSLVWSSGGPDGGAAAACTLCAALMIATGTVTVVALQYNRAPYGKFAGDARGWWYGPLIPGSLAWALQEIPALLTAGGAWIVAAQRDDGAHLRTISPPTILLALFCAHYAHRSLIYPLRLRGSKPTPALIAALAAAFCTYNGMMQGLFLARVWNPPHEVMSSPAFIAGVCLCLLGAAINYHSDGVLRALRRPGGKDKGYGIPVGGLFTYVSSANYFGEILEWAGWALASCCLPQIAFAYFTLSNIGPRGAQHHAWLRSYFGDKYPQHRRAVIPFIW